MSLSILLVDDDPVFRKLVCSALSQRGLEFVEAARLREADKLLAQRTFDLIVCDGLLPDGDGARWVRERRESLPKVVFCSSFYRTPREQREVQLATRADVLLRKPLDLTELCRAVDRLLGLGTPAAANVPGVTPTMRPEVRRSAFGDVSALLLNTLTYEPG